MIRLVLVALAIAIGSACVSKGKYEAALADNDQLHNRIDGMTLAMGELNQRITKLEGDILVKEQELREASAALASKAAEAGALEQSVAEMEVALAELRKRKAQTEAAMQAYRDLVSRFQGMIDAGTLKVKVIDGRMVVELATDILFPRASASLSRDGRKAIAEVAKVLATLPDREIQVAGHTDNDPISTSTFPSNWHLGSARAIAVTFLLVKEGVAPDRVSAASYAEHRPADTNRTRQGKAANRRIEIVIVPDMSQMPGYDELRSMTSSTADSSGTGAQRPE